MRVLLDTSYLFDFMDRPENFPDSERRILGQTGAFTFRCRGHVLDRALSAMH